MNTKPLSLLFLTLQLLACSGHLDLETPDADADASPRDARVPVDAAPDASAPDGAVDDGGVGVDAAVLEERHDLTLAPRGRATVSFASWVASGESAAVEDAGAGSVVTTDGGAVTIDALRGARGSTTVAIRSKTGRARAFIAVAYEPKPWAYAGNAVYRAELPTDVATSADDEAGLWHASAASRYGTERTATGSRAIGWATVGGSALPLALPSTATGATLRHQLWGSLRVEGTTRPARFDEATATWTTLSWLGAAEIYDAAGTVLVGASHAGAAPHAIRCATDAEASCEIIEPAGATSSVARALGPTGEVLGCADVGGVTRPFERRPGLAAEIALAPAVGCLSGTAGGLVVGEVEARPGETWGFVRGAPSDVHVDRSWGTKLFGGGLGGLLGSARDVEGHWRPASLLPVAAPPRVRLEKGVEAPDPELAHACGHTTLGPFASLVATDNVDTTSTIVRTHTSYAVTRVGSVPTSVVKLSNTRAGQITLHLSRFVPLRLVDPDGARVRPTFADDTELCADLSAFVQFDLTKVGTYVVELGPTPLDNFRIVYERTWIVAR